MKRKTIKGIAIGVMLSLMCTFVTSAATVQGQAMTSVNEVSWLLPEGETESHSKLQLGSRGLALSDSLVSITNQGGGVIGIVASSAFHQPVDWGMLTIFLDVYTEAGNWKCVDIFEYEFTKEEQPDGELTSMTVGLLIDNQPANHYYRLRGMHEVEFTRDDGNTVWEGQTTRTDGIKITK